MASETWSLTGIDTQGLDLVLSQIQPWSASGAVTPVGIQSSAVPRSGVVTDLSDSSVSQVVFSAEDVWAPGFTITFSFSEPVDLWGFRFAGPSAATWPKRHTLSSGDKRCPRNRVPWVPNGLSPAPSAPPNFTTEPGVWTEQSALGSKSWRSAAASVDGQTLLVGGKTERPWLSKDAGATWAAVAAIPAGNWAATAVSGDGLTIFAGAYGGAVWLSKDGGTTWVAQTALGSDGWACAAISANGLIIVCGIFGGALWMSKDGGVTWAAQATLGSNNWRSAAVSGNGQLALVGGSTGYPQLTKDGGDTWAPVTPVGSGDRTVSAVSGDGQTLLSGSYGGLLWLSKDAGTTWVAPSAFGNASWWQGAASSDGRVLLGVVLGGGVYMSKDGGTTWVKQAALPDAQWRAAALSSNGLVTLVGADPATIRIRIDEDPIYLPNDLFVKRLQPVAALSNEHMLAQGELHTHRQRAFEIADVEFGGNGRVYGTVERKNTPTNIPLRRRVRLHRSRDGLLVRETWSKADGSYEFKGVSMQYEYDTIAWDNEMSFRSVVANNLTPETM